ncbi:MAG: pyridoxal 5'-phosphate synthase glutaminase subunit PdxT [Mycobacteriales bacterium]
MGTQGDENAGRGRLPTIGVLALQGDAHFHLKALRAVGAHAIALRRTSELDRVDGMVIPGGESTTISRLAVTFGLFEPLQERIAAGMPVFGSCAGAILLASAIVDGREDQRCLGGIDMTVRRNAFGRQADSFETELHVTGITDSPGGSGDHLAGQKLRAIFIRAPWIEDHGADVQVLAHYNGRIVAARQGDVLATAFHPELSGDYRVHTYFVDIVAAHLR